MYNKLVNFTVFLGIIIMFNSLNVHAQSPHNSDINETFWKLKGFRHGKNYFKKVSFEETKPLKDGEWDFRQSV